MYVYIIYYIFVCMYLYIYTHTHACAHVITIIVITLRPDVYHFRPISRRQSSVLLIYYLLFSL